MTHLLTAEEWLKLFKPIQILTLSVILLDRTGWQNGLMRAD